jgi:hypothetical protein
MEQNRERLKELHASDLTEGRINQDFVDWLKTKGTTYLLFAVILLLAYAGYVRWNHHRHSYHRSAWADLNAAALPSSFEDVAEKYSDVGSVSHLARLKAAGELMRAIQSGDTLGGDAQNQTPLTPETRNEYLDRADSFYQKVASADDKSDGMALFVHSALTGRAAVAESKGQIDQAKQFYSQAAERVATLYPALAEQARERASNVDRHVAEVTLPKRADLGAIQSPPQQNATPVNVDTWVNEILAPKN